MKRIFAFLLTLVIVAGLVPAAIVPVHATQVEELHPQPEDINVAEETAVPDAPAEQEAPEETVPPKKDTAAATEVTELTEVKKDVAITGNEPAIGMAVSDLTATVSKVRLEGIHVYNAYTEEEITEGCFESGIVYQIHYVLTPYEGQKFAESVGLTFNRGYHLTASESEIRLVYKRVFSDCRSISQAKFTVPLLDVGMNPKEIELSVPEDANFTVENFKIIDLQDKAEAEVFRMDRQYRLQFTVIPNKGYVLNGVFFAYCNNVEMTDSLKNCCTYAECYIDFSLDVGRIPIDWSKPLRMNAGDWLRTPVLYISNDRVKASNERWTDAQKNPLTGNVTIKGGELYYLTFDIYTIGPVGPWETPNVIRKDHEITVEVIDGTHATVYVPFVGLRDMGTVYVNYQGFEQGKPVSGLTAEIQGNARLEYRIIDDWSREITDGDFKAGEEYCLRLYIHPLEGYFTGHSPKVVVNGKEYTWSYAQDSLYIDKSLDTRYIIDTAKVNVSGVGVGKTIAKVKITPASGSKFDVWEENWSATDTSSTKFKKGEFYQLRLVIDADEEYRFTDNTTFTIGGKKAFDVEVNGDGDRLYGTIQFSYLTDITKATLPEMPKSVAPGAALPTNFKVSSSAKYTLEAAWVDIRTQQAVTTAGQSGSYVLTYVALAKDGYEFTKDTVFYVGGKKVKPLLVTTFYAEIMEVYNVGLTEIDRIDLTVAEPEKDAIPGMVTVSADAPYAPVTVGWGVNTSGKLDSNIQTATVFENYKYHFLGAEFVAANGYAFADKVTVYINGNKFAVLEDYAFGPAYQMTVSFGKLGEIAKLTAPELSKNGTVLSWGSVWNADGYEIYRATSKSGKYTKVATITETTWTDSPTAGKTYYYKVKAIFTPDTTKNSGYSNIVSIAYKCSAPEISVENDSKGKPKLSWEKVGGAKKYNVYRATSETGKYSKLGTTTKTYYTDSKAKSGTTYFYKIVANGSSSTYNSGYSNIVSCNVICGTPSVTVKIDSNTGKPSLSWKKIEGATLYRVLRQLPGEETFTVLAEQTGVTFADKTAPIDTLCVYMVQALGKTEELNGQLSKEISATSGIAKPAVKGSVDAITGKPTLTWEAVEGAVKYEIYRSTKSTKSYKLLTTVEGLSYEDTTVSAGKTYYYKVKAIGEVSKSADSSYVKLTGKCATPEISVSVNEKSGKPVLTWEKVSSAKKYTIYRATSETGKYSKLGTTTKLTYTDSKASVGTVYYYKVIANPSSSKYNSAYSNVVSCGAYCATPVVKVSNNASGKTVLSWSKVTGAAKYEIYLLGADEYMTLATVTGTGWTDSDVGIGEGRYYGVRAIAAKEGYESEVSEPVFGRGTCATPKANGKVGANKKPVISWDEVEGATKYIVYRSTSKSKGYKAIGEATELPTYEDLTAKKGKTYYYKVVAVGEGCQSAQSSYVKIKSK